MECAGMYEALGNNVANYYKWLGETLAHTNI